MADAPSSMEKLTVRMAVRDFALPVPRTGHIESNSGYEKTAERGSEIHTVVQNARKRASDTYRAEVFVKETFKAGPYSIIVSGRMDGIDDGGDTLLIEEIKTAFNADRLVSKLSNNAEHPYLHQLRTYAYIQHKISGKIPECRLCVVSQRNFAQEHFDFTFDPDAYETWLSARLEELEKEIKFLQYQETRRRKLSKSLTFPFEQRRQGQQELIDCVAQNCDGKHMLLQAPTGLGKTAAIMTPMVQNALSRGVQTFYLTPKNSQHELAETTVDLYAEQGSKVKALTLTAKSKICFKPEPLCQPDYCEFAKDYYDKLAKHQVIKKLLSKGKMDRKAIETLAKKYEVCPYQLSRDASAFADVIIGDYHYGFAPLGKLETKPSVIDDSNKPNLVVDEAHNLFSRINDYYSAEIREGYLHTWYERLSSVQDKFRRKAISILDNMLQVFENNAPPGFQKESRLELELGEFTTISKKLSELVTKYLESDVEIERKDPLLDLQRYWDSFCDVVAIEGEQFFHLYQTSTKDRSLVVSCCDASEAIADALSEFENVAAFSATLKPFDYYARLSGFNQDKLVTAEFDSPFPKENRKVLVIPQVSTVYRHREQNYGKIANAIERLISVRGGNYIVFFPSFPFLHRVHQLLNPGTFDLFVQKQGQSAGEVSALLKKLDVPGGNHLILAVQGGVLSEGVDYNGEKLIGAIIIGPGIPNHNLERTLHRDYYEERYGQGFDYAYTFPAMAKVIQAAGRVIRGNDEKGLIVLMDSRFVKSPYREVLPRYWYGDSVDELVSTKIIHDIEEFWKKGGTRSIGKEQINDAAPQP